MLLEAALVGVQTLLTFSVDGGDDPVRFGWKVPVAALQQGIRLVGDPGAAMQWRLLQEVPGWDGKALWIVVEVCGHDGPGRLLLGGAGPIPGGVSGAVCSRETTLLTSEDGSERVEVDTWADGTVDRRVLSTVLEDGRGPVRRFEDGGSVLARRSRVRISGAEWRRVGLLPRADGTGRTHRRALIDAVTRLGVDPEDPFPGDFVRGGDGETVTNLEFDTTLGLLRLALCESDPGCLSRAFAAARHAVDVDIDATSGLPFRHGPGHRVARPEPGHVWTTGLLLTGAVFGEREIFDAGLGIARALAARVTTPEPEVGPRDRLRDEAWPLHELERTLLEIDLPPLRRGADAVADRILGRFDPVFRCLRYGEGETRAGRTYRDRLWLSLGIAVPALSLRAARSGDPRAAEVVDTVRQLAAELLGSGEPGVPVSVTLADGRVVSATRSSGIAEGYLLLEGLTPAALRDALRRRGISSALDGALDPRHDDLATRFSIAARCEWVFR